MNSICLVTNNRAVARNARRAIATVGLHLEQCGPKRESIKQQLGAGNSVFLVDSAIEESLIYWINKQIVDNGRGTVILLSDKNTPNSLLNNMFTAQQAQHIIGGFGGIDSQGAPTRHHGSLVDELELAVTCQKLSTTDYFGLDKYLSSWGIRIHQRKIQSSDQKLGLIAEIESYLGFIDCHTAIMPSISLVIDELFMNAIFNAPRDENGTFIYRETDRRTVIRFDEANAPTVRYGCDGQYVGISISDTFGSLDQGTILNNLARCMSESTARIKRKPAGAGLGLFMTYNTATKLIFNLAPDKQTEVIALFYIRDGGKAFRSRMHSFHIFEE